jgi:hypothetical protein
MKALKYIFAVILIGLLAVLFFRVLPESRSAYSAEDFLNPYLIKAIGTFSPEAEIIAYAPRGGAGSGTSRDVIYKGETILSADMSGCYCSGTTFEIFNDACALYNQEHGLPENIYGFDVKAFKAFRRDWYIGPNGDEGTNVAGLVNRGLGVRIEYINDAKPGDLIQFWRVNGVGHNVILISLERDDENDVIGFHYWSCQKSTEGYDYKTEYFNDSGGRVVPERTHIARAFTPDKRGRE